MGAGQGRSKHGCRSDPSGPEPQLRQVFGIGDLDADGGIGIAWPRDGNEMVLAAFLHGELPDAFLPHQFVHVPDGGIGGQPQQQELLRGILQIVGCPRDRPALAIDDGVQVGIFDHLSQKPFCRQRLDLQGNGVGVAHKLVGLGNRCRERLRIGGGHFIGRNGNHPRRQVGGLRDLHIGRAGEDDVAHLAFGPDGFDLSRQDGIATILELLIVGHQEGVVAHDAGLQLDGADIALTVPRFDLRTDNLEVADVSRDTQLQRLQWGGANMIGGGHAAVEHALSQGDEVEHFGMDGRAGLLHSQRQLPGGVAETEGDLGAFDAHRGGSRMNFAQLLRLLDAELHTLLGRRHQIAAIAARQRYFEDRDLDGQLVAVRTFEPNLDQRGAQLRLGEGNVGDALPVDDAYIRIGIGDVLALDTGDGPGIVRPDLDGDLMRRRVLDVELQ